jgi:hypothetical protein
MQITACLSRNRRSLLLKKIKRSTKLLGQIYDSDFCLYSLRGLYRLEILFVWANKTEFGIPHSKLLSAYLDE